MKRIPLLMSALMVCAGVACANGEDDRVEVASVAKAVAGIALRDAFPSLRFSSPLDIQPARDGTGRTFVVEQGGKVWSVKRQSGGFSKRLALDISTLTQGGGERGLLGLALHPRFKANGFVFVNYTAKATGGTRISRFKLRPSGTTGSASEFRLLEIAQPFANHNGGGLAFGPDNYLYIALGDGGSGGDPLGNGQSLATLLGKILRIDVNRRTIAGRYGVPSDNPFVGDRNGARSEIFAYGLRNPYRISFDRPSGTLWAGDVGQGEVEEIDIIKNGGNYGWNILEGTRCFSPSSGCDSTGTELPVTEYRHNEGQSVTGGYVYRGRSIPSLQGHYIFGDFVSGRIWSFNPATAERTLLLEPSINISSFGRGVDGEILVVSYSEGKVYRIGRA